jgi:uncharacterized damage-inducible protein DinB
MYLIFHLTNNQFYKSIKNQVMRNSIENGNSRALALANRLMEGAANLASFTQNLSDKEWETPVVGDGRSIGVVVHHVANVYPLEIELALVLANGQPITEATKDAIDQMNAGHANEFSSVSRKETLEHLKQNSKAAAEAIKKLSDRELDNSSTVSLYHEAPLTCQFFIEDHALRHSFHHLAKIKESL